MVWLERYGIFASARHSEVHAGLTNWETFCSAAGVGIDDFRRTKPFRPPSLILEADPPLHTRSRTVLNRALSAKAMAGLRARFQDAAERLADDLVKRRRVDAIKDIAEAYPLSVFPAAVGLGPEGLENLLALRDDGLQRVRAAQQAFRGFDGPGRRSGRLDQRPMRA